MMYINWQWQRQLNGKLSESKLVRRQQQIPLFIGPIALFVLVLVFDAAVGTMIFLMASDLFNYVIQTIWLSRRPITRSTQRSSRDCRRVCRRPAISRAVNPVSRRAASSGRRRPGIAAES